MNDFCEICVDGKDMMVMICVSVIDLCGVLSDDEEVMCVCDV